MPRRELSDADWELIEPLLPIGEYGPYPEHLRDQLEGIIWRFRTGSPWRDVPEAFGPWSWPLWRRPRRPKKGRAKGTQAPQATSRCPGSDPGAGDRAGT
ncbi:transposase [Streptomyces sp. NPDC005480]|uniref:transposase n=1 Tax=Streptomyces sp. NPDC005480 TaxID=3154880 RepID=UPI0033A0FE03